MHIKIYVFILFFSWEGSLHLPILIIKGLNTTLSYIYHNYLTQKQPFCHGNGVGVVAVFDYC